MQKRNRRFVFIAACLILLLAGCGGRGGKITDGRESLKGKEDSYIEEVEILKETDKLYIVTAIDSDRSVITLQDWETTREKPFNYTGATYFKGKYGDNLTVNQISVGELVTVERRGETLVNVQISDEVFSYDDLYHFTLDLSKQTLSVGGSTYFFDDKVSAYHGNSKISLSEISEQDTICLRGIDKQIYTIQVLAGHGTVALKNTDIFQGGYITIGNMISMKIVPQMRIEVAEGTYLLTVANDGYGGSREITVEANQETAVDLNELKGEGPKSCQIQFKVEPANTEVYLDGQKIDISKAVEVRYGTHRLTAKAEGYEEWSRTLIVNSKTAELTIKLTDKSSDETISTSNPPGNNNSNNNNSNNNNNNNNNSNNNNNNNNRNNNTNKNNNTNNNNNNSNNNNNNNSNNNVTSGNAARR